MFRGYRAVPVAFSGLLALTVATFQSAWLGDPTAHVETYLALWVGAALLSMLATAVEMLLDNKRRRSPLALQTTWLALGQFMPSVVAGGLLLLVLTLHARESLWMLPGLWALLFSLGIFASYRLLPRHLLGGGVLHGRRRRLPGPWPRGTVALDDGGAVRRRPAVRRRGTLLDPGTQRC